MLPKFNVDTGQRSQSAHFRRAFNQFVRIILMHRP